MTDQEYHNIILKVGPDIEELLQQFKELGGRLPAEISYGMVAGYLRGKGFTWDEAFIGMYRFIDVIEKHYPPKDIGLGTFTIKREPGQNIQVEIKPEGD